MASIRSFLARRLGLLFVGCAVGIAAAPAMAQRDDKPPPTHRNVRYGPHERNVLDFWRADSDRPTPLVVYIHGGGFRVGSKESLNPATLRQLLDAGISVAAVNYRFVQQAPLPAAHHDCRRSLQFLRSKAKEWNIDKTRVGAFGGSAGAQLCMYLAFHDDMARPDSSDPVERESTRLSCVATMGGQTTLDLDWWLKNIPGYDKPHRDFRQTFGVDTKEAYLKKAADISALSLISKDDPPIFMTYSMAPDAKIPSDPRRARGWKVHHVAFGIALKKKMDDLGIEAHLKYPGVRTAYPSIASFFIAKLTGGESTAARQQPARPNRLIARLRASDKDGDGKISKSEVPERLQRLFNRIDANGDGFIDADELDKLADRLRRRSPRAPRSGRPGRTAAVPDNVRLITDIAYREGNRQWRLDLAMPKEPAAEPRPAIVFVHGGGWRSGDKGRGIWRSLPLTYAAKGYVCISVNYRFSTEAPFPACVEDVKCAVRWLRAHADKYGVDPNRIGAYGNSAGAHLVAMLGLVGRDADLEGDGPYPDQSSLVQAVCCSATPTDLANWSSTSGRQPRFYRDGGLLAGPEATRLQRAKKASPITYVRNNAPPFLVVHGTADRLVPVSQADRFVDALKKAGARDVTYLRYDDAGHGVFRQHADETYPAMERFFARTLGGKD